MEGHQSYALVFTLFSVLVAIAISVMVYQTRNEARMKVRFPVVLWMEVFFSAIHSANVAMWYVGYYAPDLCQPSASIIEGMEWFIASLFIGRMALIYMQAKVNNLIPVIPKWCDDFVNIIAYLTAPTYYYRYKELHETAKALKSSQPNVVAVATSELADPAVQKKKIPGWVRYAICACIWGAYGFVSSYIFTTTIPKDPEAVEKYFSIDCWLNYIRFQTAALFLLCGVICFFFVALFSKVRDLVGTRHELVITLTIVGIAKIFNGFNIAILFFTESFWGDIISVFMYPFAVYLITFIYIYRFDAVFRSIFKGSHHNSNTDISSSLKSWKDIEKIWNSGLDGKSFVTKIAQQLYMVEIIQFLEATDSLTEGNLSSTVYKNLYNLYVKENSKLQINISHTLRNRWEKVVSTGGHDWSLLNSTRMEMFILIWPGIARHVHRTIAESKALESVGGSSRKDGGSSHHRKPSHLRTTSGGGESVELSNKSGHDSGVGFTSPPGHVRKTSTGSSIGGSTAPGSPVGAVSGEAPRKLSDVYAEQMV